VTFTERLKSLSITATAEDKTEHLTFTLSSSATFSLLAQFSEPAVYDSLARLNYRISETGGRFTMTATVNSTNDWGKSVTVMMGIPSDYNHEGGEPLFERGFSSVLRVAVTNGETEPVTIWSK